MTKKSIYTLLSTAILSSGPTFAMDFTSPEVSRKVAQLPTTTQIKAEAESVYPDDGILSPTTRPLFVDLLIDERKQKRDDEKKDLLRQKEMTKKTARQKEEAEARVQLAIETRRDELARFSAILEASRKAKAETERRASELADLISASEATQADMAAQISRVTRSLEDERAYAAIKIEEAAHASATQLALMEEEVAKEKEARAKLKETSMAAIERLKASFSENRDKLARLTAERDELQLRNIALETEEKGLTRQIEMITTSLESARSLVDSDSRGSVDLAPRKASTVRTPTVSSAPDLEGAAAALFEATKPAVSDASEEEEALSEAEEGSEDEALPQANFAGKRKGAAKK